MFNLRRKVAAGYISAMMLNRALLCLCLMALSACDRGPQGVRIISGAADPIAQNPIQQGAVAAPQIAAPQAVAVAPQQAPAPAQRVTTQALCANGLPPPSAQGCVAIPKAQPQVQLPTAGQGVY